ncbi:MAG: non-heme iron oxygenase ferredoxin subunit [Steroidobacterales bacterium]
MGGGWQDLGRVEEFGDGASRVFEVAGREIAVVRSADRFYAIDNACTHDGEELASGAVEGDEIICPRHGARFCLRTGEALTPPAYEPVRIHELRVSDGRVSVRSAQ